MGLGEGFDLGSPEMDPDAAAAAAASAEGGLESEEGFLPADDSHRDLRWEVEEGGGLVEEGFGGLPPAILLGFDGDEKYLEEFEELYRVKMCRIMEYRETR